MTSNQDWSAATWEGSRRAQIRRNLRLTVRERLEALEELTETSEQLARTAREAARWDELGHLRRRMAAARHDRDAQDDHPKS